LSIYNVTHGSDLDGIASAALLVHYYGVPLKNIAFINHSGMAYDDGLSFIKGIRGRGNLLIISDFGIIKPLYPTMLDAVRTFKKNGNRIIWLDHHPWKDHILRGISRYCDVIVAGENRDYCGAELVYKLLCKNDSYGKRLTRITHLADFALRSGSKRENHLVDKIGYAIKHMGNERARNPRLLKLVKCIADGDIDSKFMNAAYASYRKRADPELRKLRKTVNTIETHGIRIGVGFGKRISHQEACMMMLEKMGYDVAIYISSETGHSSIRSRRDSKSWGVDSSHIAFALDGGGHPLASGFSLEDSGLELDKKEVQMGVVQRIREISEGLYGKRIRYYQQDTGKRKTE
jgi:oligoribonuclease NrnB/cAMP/cGMP phosphodiesterase (DHH superfamily)